MLDRSILSVGWNILKTFRKVLSLPFQIYGRISARVPYYDDPLPCTENLKQIKEFYAERNVGTEISYFVWVTGTLIDIKLHPHSKQLCYKPFRSIFA